MNNEASQTNQTPNNPLPMRRAPGQSIDGFDMVKKNPQPVINDMARARSSLPSRPQQMQRQPARMDSFIRSAPNPHLQPRSQPNTPDPTMQRPMQGQSARLDSINGHAPIAQNNPAQSRPQPVYPGALPGVAARPHQAPIIKTSKLQKMLSSINFKTIPKPIKNFAGLMIVLSALSLITWLIVLRLPGVNSVSYALGLILMFSELILGVAILTRRKLVRYVYVFSAITLLIFSIYGTYNYFNAVHKLTQTEQAGIVATKQQIGVYQNMASLSDSNKTQIILVLNKYINKYPVLLTKAKGTLLPLVEVYAISLVPLVYLNRPSIKKAFI